MKHFLITSFAPSGNIIIAAEAGKLHDVQFNFAEYPDAWISETTAAIFRGSVEIVDQVIFCAACPVNWEPAKMAKDPDGNKWYNRNNIKRMARAIRHYRELLDRGIELHVTISAGNDKIGRVKNVSLLPYFSCDGICKSTCAGDCYAAKIAAIYGSALNAWAKNTVLARYAPDLFWAEVDKAITKRTKYFRFHVAGDADGPRYMQSMIDLVKNKSWCRFWTYTKKWALYNQFADQLQQLDNFAVLFSGWNETKPINPFKFIETDVIEPGAPVPEGCFLCPGNCQVCIDNNTGCVVARIGGKIFKIVFYKH